MKKRHPAGTFVDVLVGGTLLTDGTDCCSDGSYGC
jgi:hypothetical protein